MQLLFVNPKQCVSLQTSQITSINEPEVIETYL